MRSEVERPQGRALKTDYQAESDQSQSLNSCPHVSFLVSAPPLRRVFFVQPRIPAAAQKTNVNLASLHSQAPSSTSRGTAPGFDLDSSHPFEETQEEFTSDLGHRDHSSRLHRQSSIWPEESAREPQARAGRIQAPAPGGRCGCWT